MGGVVQFLVLVVLICLAVSLCSGIALLLMNVLFREGGNP
jgi:hypothetical protein